MSGSCALSFLWLRIIQGIHCCALIGSFLERDEKPRMGASHVLARWSRRFWIIRVSPPIPHETCQRLAAAPAVYDKNKGKSSERHPCNDYQERKMSQPLQALTTVSYRDGLYDMLIGLFLSIGDWFSKYLDPLTPQ